MRELLERESHCIEILYEWHMIWLNQLIELDLVIVCELESLTTTTFLNDELDEEIYMQQPKGFAVRGQDKKIC